jgi:hypothetical protein
MSICFRFIAITLLFLPFNLVFAQDTIYTYKKQKLAVDIIEVRNDQVAFKLSNSDDRSEYYLSKDEIAVIVYRDGKMESFSTKKLRKKSLSKTKSDTLKLGNNFVSMNASDALFGQLTINYERILKSGYFSFKVPLSMGLYQIGGGSRIYSDDLIYYSLNKIFSTGLNFHFYPYNQGYTKLYLGPTIETGLYKNANYYYLDTRYPETKKINFYASFQFHTGVLFTLNNKFQIATSIGFGRNFAYSLNRIAIRPGVNVGYRF